MRQICMRNQSISGQRFWALSTRTRSVVSVHWVGRIGLGLWGDVLRLQRETLVAQKRVLGNEHPDTLKTMHCMATAYCSVGNWDDGIHWYEETLKLRKSALGEKHPETLRSAHG